MAPQNTPQSVVKKQREQAAALQTNRTVLYLSLDIAAMLLLIFLDRCVAAVHMLPVFRSVSMTALIAFGFCLILSLSLFRSAARAGNRERLLQPEVLALLSAVGLLAMVFIRFFYSDGIKLFYVLVPGLYVLYLIKLVYGNPFCCIASYLFTAGSLLYAFNRLLQLGLMSSMQLPFGLLLSLTGVLFISFCRLVRCKGGNIRWRGGVIELFRGGDSILPAMLSGLLFVALGALFVQTTAYALFYGIIALGGTLVLIGLYYTYMLMYR